MKKGDLLEDFNGVGKQGDSLSSKYRLLKILSYNEYRLQKQGLKAYRPRKKPQLTEKVKLARYQLMTKCRQFAEDLERNFCRIVSKR